MGCEASDDNKMNDFVINADGSILWNMSLIMGLFLKDRNIFTDNIKDGTSVGSGDRKPRVLELGCGTGQLTVEMAKMGASVVATDLGKELAVAGKYISHYTNEYLSQSGEAAQPLDIDLVDLAWGEEYYSDSGFYKKYGSQPVGFDFVIMSDLIFFDHLHESLAYTLNQIVDLNPHCVIYNGFLDRPFSTMFNVIIDDMGYTITEESGYNALGIEDVHINKIIKS